MGIKQIKEHFKNAKEVRCVVSNNIFNIEVSGNYEHVVQAIAFRSKSSQNNNANCVLYDNSKPINKFAEIISYKDTQQEPEKSEYPKVMLVSFDKKKWEKRVVFMKKNKYFISWNGVETIKEAKTVYGTISWDFAKELPIEIEVTKEEIAKWKGCEVEQLIIK